jgi:hypothetical protein
VLFVTIDNGSSIYFIFKKIKYGGQHVKQKKKKIRHVELALQAYLCLGFLVSGLAQGSNNLGLSVWPCFVFS